MMKGTQYILKAYVGNKNNKLVELIDISFEVNPKIKFVKLIRQEPDGSNKKEDVLNKKALKSMNNSLKEWLFRKSSAPITLSNYGEDKEDDDEKVEVRTTMVWDCEKLSEDDKKVVMHQYMFEEL